MFPLQTVDMREVLHEMFLNDLWKTETETGYEAINST